MMFSAKKEQIDGGRHLDIQLADFARQHLGSGEEFSKLFKMAGYLKEFRRKIIKRNFVRKIPSEYLEMRTEKPPSGAFQLFLWKLDVFNGTRSCQYAGSQSQDSNLAMTMLAYLVGSILRKKQRVLLIKMEKGQKVA